MDTYKATNTNNGRFYIGSTTNFERRKVEHLRSRENLPFQNALRKDPSAFEWEVYSDDSDEPTLEQALLDMWYGTEMCYNINPFASRPPLVKLFGERNGMFGRSHTEISRQRMSKSHQDREPDSKETREKKSLTKRGENNPNYGLYGEDSPRWGQKHSPEAIETMRQKGGHHVKGSSWYHYFTETGEKKAKRFYEEPPEPWIKGRGPNG
jgi:group I intron endonuclease